MNKFILLLLYAFLVSNIAIAQKKDNYNERIKSSGIKSKTIYLWQYENDKPNDSVIYSFTKFNINGRTLTSITYKNGQINSEFVFKYNSNDEIKSGNNILYDDSGDTSYVNKTYYDSKGRIIETNNTYGLGKYGIKTLYSYDKKNKIQISKNIGEFDTTIYTTSFVFDVNGNTIKSIHKDKEGKIYSEWINTYDENDNLIEQQYKDYSNKLFDFSNKSKFNNDNFETERRDYDCFGKLKSRFAYSNDENGNIKEYIEYDEKDNVINKFKVKYTYY